MYKKAIDHIMSEEERIECEYIAGLANKYSTDAFVSVGELTGQDGEKGFIKCIKKGNKTKYYLMKANYNELEVLFANENVACHKEYFHYASDKDIFIFSLIYILNDYDKKVGIFTHEGILVKAEKEGLKYKLIPLREYVDQRRKEIAKSLTENYIYKMRHCCCGNVFFYSDIRVENGARYSIDCLRCGMHISMIKLPNEKNESHNYS